LKKTFSKLFANLFLKRVVNVYKKVAAQGVKKRKQTACDFFYFFAPTKHQTHTDLTSGGRKSERNVNDKRDTGATISSLGKQQGRLQLRPLPLDRILCGAPKVVLK
jgi:hypothetical protein